MTIWRNLTSLAAMAPGMGTLLSLMHRLGSGETGDAPELAAGSPFESAKFSMALIALSAKLARSDGAVTFDEVAAFKRIMDVPEDEEHNVRRLFDLAKSDIAGFEAYARQVGTLLGRDKTLAREVLEALLVVAAADGVLHERENAYLGVVSDLIGLTPLDYEHARNLYFAGPMGIYETLGLDPGASDTEVRQRHRQLVKEHHPDRLSGLGCSREHIERAEGLLARINAAYDAIARERGL